MTMTPQAPFNDYFPPQPPEATQPIVVMQPEAPRKSRTGALIAGVAVGALFVGTVGGAVGYTLAENDSSSTITVASAGAVAPAAGSIAAVAAAVQPSVVQLNVSGAMARAREQDLLSVMMATS